VARDDSAIPFVVEGPAYGRVSHGRRAAVAALADLSRGRRDRIERESRERIEELLRDRDFRVQSAALESLAVLADPASLPALSDVIARELDGRLRRRAREIARDIREARSPAAEVGALRDELDKLRTETSRLRERLDRIDALAPERAAPRTGKADPVEPNKPRAATVKDTVRRPPPPKRKAPPPRTKRTAR
jgi:aminopeptidase N